MRWPLLSKREKKRISGRGGGGGGRCWKPGPGEKKCTSFTIERQRKGSESPGREFTFPWSPLVFNRRMKIQPFLLLPTAGRVNLWRKLYGFSPVSRRGNIGCGDRAYTPIPRERRRARRGGRTSSKSGLETSGASALAHVRINEPRTWSARFGNYIFGILVFFRLTILRSGGPIESLDCIIIFQPIFISSKMIYRSKINFNSKNFD